MIVSTFHRRYSLLVIIPILVMCYFILVTNRAVSDDKAVFRTWSASDSSTSETSFTENSVKQEAVITHHARQLACTELSHKYPNITLSVIDKLRQQVKEALTFQKVSGILYNRFTRR